MSKLYKMNNGFDSITGAAFGGGGGGGAILPPSIRHTQYTNPHVPLPKEKAPQPSATVTRAVPVSSGEVVEVLLDASSGNSNKMKKLAKLAGKGNAIVSAANVLTSDNPLASVDNAVVGAIAGLGGPVLGITVAAMYQDSKLDKFVDRGVAKGAASTGEFTTKAINHAPYNFGYGQDVRGMFDQGR